MAYQNRHTKIVFTMGPACEDDDVLRSIIQAGGNVCRLNMAHASHEWTRQTIQRVRKVSESIRQPIPIMMDIKGPEIRTGDIEGTWQLEKDEIVHFVTDPEILDKQPSSVKSVTVNYPGIVNDVHVGNTMLVDSGLIHLEVTAIEDSVIKSKVIIPGSMGSRRHINLPGVHVNLPALTKKDIDDIKIGIEGDIVYYALSFVRQASDIEDFRKILKEHQSSAQIIAKIEDQSGVEHLEEIIEASDGVMVARGDLGIEWPFEELPVIQNKIVEAAIKRSKPVIVATHMLESMITAPIPTRAEVTDIATAIYQKSDAIMLSGETSVGQYPKECIETMVKVSTSIEKSSTSDETLPINLQNHKAKMVRAGITLAKEHNNAPIIVFTSKGQLARILSSLRPMQCPIFAFTNSHSTHKQMKLLWGVESVFIEFDNDPEKSVQLALKTLLERRFITEDEWLVAITNVKAGEKTYDSIQIRKAT